MTEQLELKFLGPPEVLYGGRAAKFATRKALALFAFLVVEDGWHPRTRLMDLLWPASETRLAQPALRNTLARIKDALRNVDEPLRTDGDRVAFNVALTFSLDLELVARATAEPQPHQLTPPTLAALERAAVAARGPFMDGFSLPDAPAFDEWQRKQRAAWEHRQNQVYDHLSLHQLETHLIQPAIGTVMRWIGLDSLNEIAYQRLMRLHFLNGNRSAALQSYETCRALLAQELGVKPSLETEEVFAYIRSSLTPAVVADSPTEARAPLHIPFVGRAHEHQGLVNAFHLIQKGKPQVVVVSGESGIGKTRLSDEFLNWAGTEGAELLRGRAFETNGRLPYQPIIDALRERLEQENAPDDLIGDVWLTELTRILPELRERYPDLPSTMGDDSTARARLFEAVARLADALSLRRPLVWLMDDLQWADGETLGLLHYLARHWQSRRAPVLLLILVRGEALGHGFALRDWMSSLTRDTPITRFTLSAMNFEDVHLLISSLAGEDAPGSSELSAWFAVETAGQPFFLSETLAALDDQGALVWQEEAPAVRLNPLATLDNLKSMRTQLLAPAIRNVVLARLEWLSQPASALLSAAAVIGRNCSFERLCQISGTGEQESLNALDELLSARMIVEARNAAKPYTVAHDRIREVVYAQLSDARQQIFHRRALAALTEANAPPAELAQHALAAREWQLAFRHSAQAGDDALGLFAVAGAIYQYETARSLLNEKKVVVDAATCQHLYTQFGQVYELEFRHSAALTLYMEMQTQAVALGNREMELAGLVARCLVLSKPYDTQDVAQAADLALVALPLAQALGDLKAQADIELSLSWTHKFGDGQSEPTIHHLQAAEQLARQAGLREQLGLVTLELGVAFIARGQLEQAESSLLESMEIYRELDHRPRVLSCLHNLAILQMESGRFDAALALLQKAYRANETLGSTTGIYGLTTTHDVIHILRGEYDKAFAALLPALDLDETQIVSGLWIDIFQQLAWCSYDLGAYDEALVQCQKAIEHHDHISRLGRTPALTLLALVQIRRGEMGEADAAVAQAWEQFDLQWEMYQGWWETFSILQAEAELALAHGELDRAARCVEQLLGKYDGLKLRHLKSGVLGLQAKICSAAGKTAQAHQAFSDALALSDEMGAHREVWALCWALGDLERARGKGLVAAQLHERARAEVMWIADHAGRDDLREIFLARPDVQLMQQSSPAA